MIAYDYWKMLEIFVIFASLKPGGLYQDQTVVMYVVFQKKFFHCILLLWKGNKNTMLTIPKLEEIVWTIVWERKKNKET